MVGFCTATRVAASTPGPLAEPHLVPTPLLLLPNMGAPGAQPSSSPGVSLGERCSRVAVETAPPPQWVVGSRGYSRVDSHGKVGSRH